MANTEIFTVLAIIPALTPPIETFNSIKTQELTYTATCIVTPRPMNKIEGAAVFPYPVDQNLPVGVRVSKSINHVLKFLDDEMGLDSFDYLLKIDQDVKLPPYWIVANAKSNMDLMGKGCAMLIKMLKFLELGGRFDVTEFDDDSLIQRFIKAGAWVLPYNWTYPPIMLERTNDQSDSEKKTTSGQA